MTLSNRIKATSLTTLVLSFLVLASCDGSNSASNDQNADSYMLQRSTARLCSVNPSDLGDIIGPSITRNIHSDDTEKGDVIFIEKLTPYERGFKVVFTPVPETNRSPKRHSRSFAQSYIQQTGVETSDVDNRIWLSAMANDLASLQHDFHNGYAAKGKVEWYTLKEETEWVVFAECLGFDPKQPYTFHLNSDNDLANTFAVAANP